MYDESRLNVTSSTSSPCGDNRSLEPEGATRSHGAVILSSSKVADGASDILGLLRLLGEGFRLSCLCRCQVVVSNLEGNLSAISFHVK